MERNERIRKILKKRRIYLYELAATMGISESTLIRWMRVPLTDEHYNRLTAALQTMKAGETNG
ncbi:MAG TPA: helix-turn-helix transcriptional regulator [Candidatus Ornithomonoglobus merdipullorum]|uniref:Helix-turn-helix transcriptional regulator n=1 Tax=Candidatus Ornithomonoglobus merdipullorum TaxID=2840895 RepID=A0A9D1SFJ6_9FIRM|nr:helix-turn-helix transcriptional regulator [Candidatus Ornithomonoglobus merdipullorum]